MALSAHACGVAPVCSRRVALAPICPAPTPRLRSAPRGSQRSAAASGKLEDVPLFADASAVGSSSSSSKASSPAARPAAAGALPLDDVPLASEVCAHHMNLNRSTAPRLRPSNSAPKLLARHLRLLTPLLLLPLPIDGLSLLIIHCRAARPGLRPAARLPCRGRRAQGG